jgi:hypothetical protein
VKNTRNPPTSAARTRSKRIATPPSMLLGLPDPGTATSSDSSSRVARRERRLRTWP